LNNAKTNVPLERPFVPQGDKSIVATESAFIRAIRVFEQRENPCSIRETLRSSG